MSRIVTTDAMAEEPPLTEYEQDRIREASRHLYQRCDAVRGTAAHHDIAEQHDAVMRLRRRNDALEAALSSLPESGEAGKCELCGQQMPDGEEMFRYHGHSGPCPKPPMKLHFTDEWVKSWIAEEAEVDFEIGPEIEGAEVFTSASVSPVPDQGEAVASTLFNPAKDSKATADQMAAVMLLHGNEGQKLQALSSLPEIGEAGAWPTGAKFCYGDRVRKHNGAWWEGIVVGFYGTERTPIGYNVQLDLVPDGPVQIYPETALEAAPPVPNQGQGELREAVVELARAGSHLREFVRYHPEESTCDIEASLYMVGKIVGQYTNKHPDVLDATRADLKVKP